MVGEKSMQNLHLDTPINGITANKKNSLFAFCTEEGIVYIGNSQNCSVDLEIALPSRCGKIDHIAWSSDGDIIYIASADTLFFFHPAPNPEINQIEFKQTIVSIYPHVDGFSIVAQFADNTISNIKPNKDIKQNIVGPFPEEDNIISIVAYQRKCMAMITSGENPQIRFLDPVSFEVQKIIEIEKLEASITAAVACEGGIVVHRADGYWTKYTENSTVSGTSCSSLFIDCIGSYLCCSCGDCIRVFDLKFDAELERIEATSQKAFIFSNNVVSIFDTEVHFREWKGLKTTTTRDLIINQLTSPSEAPECEEIRIGFKGAENDDIGQSISNEVIQSKADFKFKSVSNVINNIMDNKFVPIGLRQKVLETIADQSYDDVRDLVMFHLSTSISYKDVKSALKNGKTMNVVMMLKKIEPLTGKQSASFMRLALKSLDDNEIVLAHFLTQPLNEIAAKEAAKILSADEVDKILQFLAKIVASRRYWREFEASLSALESVNRWASILIKANLTALSLQHKTEGLKALQTELLNETVRIEAAGNCWSIIENITENKRDGIPPSFMYLVEKIEIPE